MLFNDVEIDFTDFVAFVAGKPADEVIEHLGVGTPFGSWEACAVGKYAESAGCHISDVECMLMMRSETLYETLNDSGRDLAACGLHNISTYGGLLKYIESLGLTTKDAE